MDRHGHTLAHLPALPVDGACAPDLLSFLRRVGPGSGAGAIATRIDGGLQALAQVTLQGGLERLSRTRLPPGGAGPFRAGERRVGTIVAVRPGELLLDLGAGPTASLPLPPPVACAGHPATPLLPPAARFAVGERLLVRVAALEAGRVRLALGLQGALLALDPQSRDVLALVGGYGQGPGDEDRVTRRPRPAGAAFHPLVFAAALASGRFTERSLLGGGAAGPLTMREALAQSSTPVTVRLAGLLGAEAVVALAGRLGVPAEQLPRDLSVAARAQVTPWQLAGAYATLADTRAGRHLPPRLLGDDGSEDGEGPGELPPKVAYLMSRLLHGVIEAGTATAAQELRLPDLAGKTGTGADGRDAWFAGYHADLLAVVWVGDEAPAPSPAPLSGAESALPLWIEFMRGARPLLQRTPPPLFRPPGAPPEAED